MDSMLQHIVHLVEEEGYEEMYLNLSLANGELLNGLVVPSSFALLEVARAHMALAEDMMGDEFLDHADALTLRTTLDNKIVRVPFSAIVWWQVHREPDPDPPDEEEEEEEEDEV